MGSVPTPLDHVIDPPPHDQSVVVGVLSVPAGAGRLSPHRQVFPG